MAVKLEAKEPGSFSYRVENGVAVITFDQRGEAVNTLSPEIVEEFDSVLNRALKDAEVQAVVFTSGKKDNFIAGAKIDFLQTLKRAEEAEGLSRQAQQGFDRLDAFAKPVVAAIHGSCLGGGLEWALACDYRIATDAAQTSLGQPEVQLGLIPGGGGTQRLPRLIGTPAALDLILTGKTVRPSKARKLGLVDEVVPKPILLAVAIQRARELASGKRQVERSHRFHSVGKHGLTGFLQGLTKKDLWSELALEDNPLGRRVLFEQARKQVLKKGRSVLRDDRAEEGKRNVGSDGAASSGEEDWNSRRGLDGRRDRLRRGRADERPGSNQGAGRSERWPCSQVRGRAVQGEG